MKRIRFSIRTLLILAVFAAVGIVVYQRQTKIRRVVQRLESLGGTVENRPDPSQPAISLQGLTDWIEYSIASVSIHEKYVSFQCSSQHYWNYRLSHQTQPLNPQLPHQWIEMGCEAIHLSNDARLYEDLKCLVKPNHSWTIFATRIN